MMLRIAVIGAGFAGLSAAWHLLCAEETQVVVFDRSGIGAGASGMAAGLLHPFGGSRARLNPGGREGMACTENLLRVASGAWGRPVARQTGLYRISVTEETLELYSQSAQLYPEVTMQNFLGFSALHVPEAWCVNCPEYLLGLWKACEDKGAAFEKRHVETLSQLNDFDKILITAGAQVLDFPECQGIPVKFLKGQVLELELASDLSFEVPVTLDGYIIPLEKRRCIVGATFERHFTDDRPDLEVARQLLPVIKKYFPEFENAKIVDCRAGVRVATPTYQPFCRQVAENCWVATGLGSKGLLYHGLLGQDCSLKLLNIKN